MAMNCFTLARSIPLLLIAVFATSGCLPPPETANSEDVEVISPDEIAQASQGGSAYELIETLRPYWLESRGPTSAVDDPITGAKPNFYLNQSQITEQEVRSIRAAEIQRIIAMSAAQANLRYGSGNENGAIVLYLK